MNGDALVKDLTFRVHHTMLPVADLDRSIAFYTRLLGMKVKERHASEARKVEVGLIGYGDEASVPFLELIKDTSERAPAQVTPANIHIGIDTSDLRKLCDILEKEGVTFIRPSNSGPTVWVSARGFAIRTATSWNWPNGTRGRNLSRGICRPAASGTCVATRTGHFAVAQRRGRASRFAGGEANSRLSRSAGP